MPAIAPLIKPFFCDNDGAPLAGGLLYTFETGTNNPKATYKYSSGTAHANPIELDARGEIPDDAGLYLDSDIPYRFRLERSDATEVWTRDGVTTKIDVTQIAGVAPITVDTVAAMKALTGLVDGAHVHTGCYSVSGKGAGRYRASTTVVAENGGTIINNNAATISFRLIHDGEVESAQFGALHDGTTDDSAEISALFLAASTEGFVPVISKGTAIASNITGQSNIDVRGMGYGVSIIKRPASSPNNNSIIDFTGKENFSLSGFTLDGNKASQSNAANNLTVSGCKKYKIAIESNNAKAVSGGFGDGIVLIDGTNDSAVDKSSVEGCHGSGNDSNGLSVNKEWYLNILNNKFNSNGSQGIFVANYVFPPVENSQNSLTINNNHCHFNANGIYVLGYYTGGSAVAPHYGSSTPQSRYVEIAGNHCDFNDLYGVVYQGDAGTISGNHCSRNGDLEAFGAGYLLNCSNVSFKGNTGRDNGFYGVDAGGSTNLIIAENNFISNGVTSGFGCTDINIGACRTTQVIGNTITQSGSVASTAISCAGIDGDGSTPFNQVASENFINGNVITLNSNANSIGVYAYRNSGILYVRGNHVKYPSSAKAYVLESTQVVQSDNKETADFSGGTTSQQIASAATLVIPDQGDSFLISGTTNITSIRTYSSNIYDGKVRDVRMTNNGTGYTSAPTVGFSGGGGTGAAATAELSNNGTIIGVSMTNNGSGYTSAPTVSFTGGGGSAAAGTALVGCNNFGGRVIRLHFLATLTVTDGSNLFLAGNLSAVAGTILTLRGEFGNWYEVSRSVN